MLNVVTVLAEIERRDPLQLPRYQSDRSGAVFAQITNPENLVLHRNTSLPLEARLPMALRFTEAVNQIAKIYLSAFLKYKTGDDEMVELMGTQFRSIAQGRRIKTWRCVGL